MKKLIFVLLLAVFYFIYDLLYSAGVFTTIIPFFEGEFITMYTTAPGTEDIDLDAKTGLLFVSSTDRRSLNENGGIYVMQADSGKQFRKLWSDYNLQFRPHGISVLRNGDKLWLFVINHCDQGDFVEKFEYRGDSLFHLQRYESPLMFSPNDLVATNERQFYVTNDHGYPKGGVMRTLEDYLRLPKSYVLFYDGSKFKKVVEGLRYANGINISNDAQRLFITQTTGQALHAYDIEEDGALSLTSIVPIQSGLDNIEVAADGQLWIGSHPKMLDFVAHAKRPDNLSPSQVLRLRYEDETNVTLTEVFLDDGQKISGSSVAVPYKNDIFIGVVFDSKIFRGRLSNLE